MKDSHWLAQFLSPIFADSYRHAAEHAAAGQQTELMLMAASVGLAIIAILVAINKFSKKPDLPEAQGAGKLLANKWYVDEIYDAIVVKPLDALGKFLNNVVEKSGIDWIVNGVGKGVQYGSRQLRLLQSGQVGTYVLLMIVGMLILFVLQFFLKK